MKWWGCISRIDVLACFSRTVVLLSSLSRDCSFSLSCTFCYARASSSSSTSATRLAAATNRCAYHLVHRRNRELTTKPASHPSTPFVRHIVSTLVHHVPRHKQWHRGKSASAPHRSGHCIPDGAEAAWPCLWLLGWDRRCLWSLIFILASIGVVIFESELGTRTRRGRGCPNLYLTFVTIVSYKI